MLINLFYKNNELQVAQTAKIGYSRALRRELDKLEVKMAHKINIDNREYDIDSLTDAARKFVEQLHGLDTVINEKKIFCSIVEGKESLYCRPSQRCFREKQVLIFQSRIGDLNAKDYCRWDRLQY